MDAFVVWYFLGTEIPYPSSHTKTAKGICSTPAAFMVSQKCPSLVDASPIVQKQTSFPLLLRFFKCCVCFTFLNVFDAKARPSALGICPAVGAMSLLTFFNSVRFSQSPLLSTILVAKWAFICLPALKGSLATSGSAYNCEKNCSTVANPLANIKVWSR